MGILHPTTRVGPMETQVSRPALPENSCSQNPIPPHGAATEAAHVLSPQMDPDTAAAMAIQAWWRGQLVRRALLVAASSARRIQGWWRRVGSQRREQQRLWVLAEYIKLERAVVLLQAQVRAWVMRTEYKRCREAARTIQTCWRGYVQRQASNCTKDVDLHIDIVLGVPGDCGDQSE